MKGAEAPFFLWHFYFCDSAGHLVYRRPRFTQMLFPASLKLLAKYFWGNQC